MADIKLFLYVDGVGDVRQLDIKDDKQFPLSINYTAGSYKNIDVRQGSFTLEFRIPANKNNKTALNHLNDSNVQDGDNLLHNTECSIVADGFPLFKGTFKLLGSVNDRGHEEFNCKIQSSELEWAKHMQDRTLKDYTWGTIPDISKTQIENTWTNTYTDKYIYPLCNYGEWKEKNNVLASDLRPALFVRALFIEAFGKAGYTIVENDGDGHFFDTTNSAWRDNLILPYTSKAYERSDADLDDARFTATQSGTQEVTWEISLDLNHTFENQLQVSGSPSGSIKNNIRVRNNYTISNSKVGANDTYSKAYTYYFTSGVSESDLSFLATNSDRYGAVITNIGSFIDSRPDKPIKIIDYGTESTDLIGNTDVPYVTLAATSVQDELYDLISDAETNNDSSTGGFTRGIYFVYNETGDERVIDYDGASGTGSANFDYTTNDRYNAAIPTRGRFDLSLKFYSWSVSVGVSASNPVLIEKNTGAFKFFIDQNDSITRNQWADSLVAPDDWTGETLPSDDSVNLLSIDVESGDFNVEASDYVDTSVATHSSDFARSSLNRIFNKRGTISKITCIQHAVISESEFSSTPKNIITNDSGSLDLSTVMSDEYTMLDYIKGYVHAFNLMIKTDPYNKTVTIKERDSFYDTMSNAYDWTSKIDVKKQYDLQYLDFYKRTMNYQFQRDGRDAHLQEIDKITDRKTGDYTDTLSERFEKGETNLTNPLFAYTYSVKDRNILIDGKNEFSMARLWNEFRPASQPPVYDNDFRPRILFNQYKSVGLTWSWHGTTQTSASIAVNDDYNGYGDLPYSLSYSNSGSRKGFFERFYNKTRNTIEKGTRVEIPVKLSYKDIQTLDLSRLVYFSAPAELKGYWIIDKVKNFRPSNVVTTTVELVKKEDFDHTIADATQDVVVEETDKEIDGRGGKRDDWIIKGGGGISEQDWVVEQEKDKEFNWWNDKGLSGVDKGTKPKDDKLRDSGGLAGKGSLVLSNNKNETRGGSGNAVFGRGNRVMGSNQTVMGSYAQTNTTLNMAVGAGTSPNDRYNALSVDRNGIVREGEGHLVTNDNGDIKQVYEEVNGELVKITL